MVALSFASKTKREQDQQRVLAWSIEALARTKRLPELDRWLGRPMVEQSEEEMFAAMQQWIASHNARWALSQQLGMETVN